MRKHKISIVPRHPFEELFKVLPPLVDKLREFFSLFYTDSCLQISHFEVIANMRVNILVVISCRKVA